MKKLLITLAILSCNSFALLPVTVDADIPATIRETTARIDATTQLQTMISAINKAQTTAGQIQALKNLQDLQKNPGASVAQVNSAVSGLVGNFNTLNNSGFQNLSQLIGSLAGSMSSTGMNIKLMQASNMQLAGIQNTLQTLQAQNQALVAYQQAQANEQTRQGQYNSDKTTARANALNGL